MSLRWRRRIEGLLLLLGIAAVFAAMHVLTPFRADDPAWWRYLVVNGVRYQHVDWPYAGYLLAAPAVGLGLALAFRFGLRYSSYGAARYATLGEAKKFGLRAKHGMVLGAMKGKPLVVDAARHVMVSAGTQSGKTQGIVIPTLLEYPGAAVVIDAKGELWDATAGARSKFSDVYRLEWTNAETARYNPLSLEVLPDDENGIERQVGQVATILAPAEGKGDGYFEKDAQRLINAIALCEVFDARFEARDASMTAVAHWCSSFDADIRALAEELVRNALHVKLAEAAERARQRGYPERVANDLDSFALMASRQLSGVVGTVEAELQAYKSGAVRTALSGCDFTARSLVAGDRPGTVYVVVQPADRKAVASMTTALITNIVFTLISRTSAEAKAQHSMLLLLEEFTSLKKTPAIPEAYDRGAGLRLHVMTVIQAFAQVQEIYGREALETFLQNTDYLVAFAQGDERSREMLARMVGKATRVRESRSDSGKGDSFSQSLEGVDLMLPQEWGSIPFGEHRILVKRHHDRPVRAKTAFAYRDSRYRNMLGAGVQPPVRPGYA